VKLTRALKIKPTFIIILLVAGICFSQTDSSPEDSVAAKFCFYADTSRLNTQIIDSAWKLSVYEQVIPLTVTIQTEYERYVASFSAELFSEEKSKLSLWFLGSKGCVSVGSNGKHYNCTVDINKEYHIYDYLSFSYSYKDSTKTQKLFGKVVPLEWSLNFSMGTQKQKIVGDNTVYISGFCNKEQLEQVKELKKKNKHIKKDD
jgi:hypothetical protein